MGFEAVQAPAVRPAGAHVRIRCRAAFGWVPPRVGLSLACRSVIAGRRARRALPEYRLTDRQVRGRQQIAWDDIGPPHLKVMYRGRTPGRRGAQAGQQGAPASRRGDRLLAGRIWWAAESGVSPSSGLHAHLARVASCRFPAAMLTTVPWITFCAPVTRGCGAGSARAGLRPESAWGPYTRRTGWRSWMALRHHGDGEPFHPLDDPGSAGDGDHGDNGERDQVRHDERDHRTGGGGQGGGER